MVMLDPRQMLKLLAPLKRRIQLMLSRAVVKVIYDSYKLQNVQVTLLSGEVMDDVERFQNYGFTGHPPQGSEAIVASLGGSRSHAVVICVENREFRLRNLQKGEVALYTDEGDVIHFKRGNQILIDSAHTVNVNGATEVNVNGGAINLVGGGNPAKGIVQGDCVCAFTGAPHPQVSGSVNGSL